ncbi:hypothetical protein JCM24511_08758 [Saitozyma sp. JCM 24511]|nr:hypothetical protein JCM24511_08758 [Saitozyma sp. JCM 24511]
MPITLKPRPSLPPFTFSPPPSDAEADASDSEQTAQVQVQVAPSQAAPPRPPADFIPERDMHMFGSRPLDSSEPGKALVKCARCGKVVMELAAVEHKRLCAHVLDGVPLDKKKLKAEKSLKAKDDLSKKRRASEDGENAHAHAHANAHASAIPAAVGGNPYKGLKKSEIKKLKKEAERLEKKRAKERQKAEIAERKRQRASEPLDFDRHCGVINDKGLPCSRSLTCKTHTVGAKRAVSGRSRPFDELHLEWQRKHNPNFKEPARRDVNGTNGAGSSTKNAKRKDSKLGKKGPAGGGPGPGEDDAHGGGPEGESQRELEELIHFTRVAGDRVRDAIGWGWSFGVGLGGGIAAGLGLMTSGTATASASRAGSSGGAAGTTAGAGTGAGAGAGAGAGLSSSAANSRATSAGPSKSNANANASGLGTGTGNGNSNGSGNPFGRPDKPRPTSCNAVWRSHTDFAGVGEMFQKALAARPPKQPQHPHHAQHQHQHQHQGHSHVGKNANANANAQAAGAAAGQHGGAAQRILPAMAAGGVPPEQAVQPGMFGVTA